MNLWTEEYLTKDFRLDLNQWLDYSRETYEGYGYDYKFIGVTDIQPSLEKTKPSLGSFTELPTGLRSKAKAILNFKRNKFNCVRLCFSAALYPLTADATKYINKLINKLISILII